MEAGLARRNRDDSSRLPALSLGLSSVRFIINKLETEHTRAVTTNNDQNREIIKYKSKKHEEYRHDSLLDETSGRVWKKFVLNIEPTLSSCIPRVSFGNLGLLAVATGLLAPRMISYLVVYPFCRLVFGTLYPAYASYKAVRTKNLKEYVKWMMYWIVFALFTCTETFTDVFLSWFPFYYEVKIVLVLWLLSPATKGSSILYRKFVHPALCRREQEIDEYIAKAKDQGYHTVLNLGTKGVNYATTVIMQTAIKGGGGLVQQLRKSYSLSDLTECEPRDERSADEADDVLTEPRHIRRGTKVGYRRSASESNSRQPMYFPEVDVDVRSSRPRTDEPDFSHVKSTEDISSGYSSADNSGSLSRAGSVGAGRGRTRTTRSTVTAIKRPQAAEDCEVIIEEPHDDAFEYANMPPLVQYKSPIYLSHTEPPFLYQYVDNQVKIIQVIGDYPLQATSNNRCNDIRDRNQCTIKEVALNRDNDNALDDINIIEDNISNNLNPDHKEGSDDIPLEDKLIHDTSEKVDKLNTRNDINKVNYSPSNKSLIIDNNRNVEAVNFVSDENIETEIDNIDSADDEASFGTPENSPKSKRKSLRGKYGKGKAPLPPMTEIEFIKQNQDKNDDYACKEIVDDTARKIPDAVIKAKEVDTVKILETINPVIENKERRKSKSPIRFAKENASSISRLLQLPSKLAFWNKNEDDSKSIKDDESLSSTNNSRRSSLTDKIDEFQSCSDISNIPDKPIAVVNVPNIEVTDDNTNNENITQNVIDKSDALQKIIDAKLQTHPEYKYAGLDEEISTTSKTTDV